jgi:hypothetical protein
MGHVSCMAKMRNAYKILVGKPKAKRLLGKPRCMWEDDIRMDLRQMGGNVWTEFIWLRAWTLDRLL